MTPNQRYLITALVGIALILRIASALTLSIHHTDEIGQYLEQAHRIVFGYGTVPWEYRYGMRHWLIPMFLSGPMALGNMIAPDTMLYLFLPKLGVVLLSIPILWAAYQIGRKSSQTHAMVALFVASIWFEFIFFAGHILSEPIAVAAILPATALFMAEKPSRNQLIAAGFLFALGALLRFHYGVAIAFIVFGLCWGQWRERLLPVIIGGLLFIALCAIADGAMGLIPFKWIFINIYQNIGQHRADAYGTLGPFSYLGGMRIWWGIGGLALILILLFRARRRSREYNILFWAAVINLIVHSLIGHKEYRFIFLSTSIFIILAAIQSVDAALWLNKKMPKISAISFPIALCVVWFFASAFLAFSHPMQLRWNAYSGMMQLMAKAGRDPRICGIGLDENYYYSGAYALLHRDIPTYITRTSEPKWMASASPIDGTPAFNATLALIDKRKQLGPDFTPVDCRSDLAEDKQGFHPERHQKICLFMRNGGCNSHGYERYSVNTWLRENDM